MPSGQIDLRKRCRDDGSTPCAARGTRRHACGAQYYTSRDARLGLQALSARSCWLQPLRDGRIVRVERKVFQLLVYLAARPTRLITKDELLSEVWDVRSISEGTLPNTVAKLGRVLGQRANESVPIETVHGRGYRFHPLSEADRDSPIAELPPAADGGNPFVGRQTTIAALGRFLQYAQAGEGQLVLLTGEAGAGKTRTARELAGRAQRAGVSVWTGEAYAGEGAPA